MCETWIAAKSLWKNYSSDYELEPILETSKKKKTARDPLQWYKLEPKTCIFSLFSKSQKYHCNNSPASQKIWRAKLENLINDGSNACTHVR
jgi:hypothetical protein